VSLCIPLTSDLTSLLPSFFALLAFSVTQGPQGTLNVFEDVFVPLSDAFQEILSSSTFTSGAGTKTLTEPLLLFVDAFGERILSETRNGV
jgi:hypothetical protein